MCARSSLPIPSRPAPRAAAWSTRYDRSRITSVTIIRWLGGSSIHTTAAIPATEIRVMRRCCHTLACCCSGTGHLHCQPAQLALEHQVYHEDYHACAEDEIYPGECLACRLELRGELVSVHHPQP